MIRKFTRALRKQQQPERSSEFAAVIGDLSGQVDAGGNLVFVTRFDGHVLSAVNRIAPNTAGTHVVVGVRDGVLQVVRARDVFGARNGMPNIPAHAETHQYPNHDTLFVGLEQVIPLLVMPVSGFTVQIYGGILPKSDGSGYFAVANQTMDLAAYQPGSGALYVVIATDDDGILSVVEGDAVDNPDSLSLADIPATDGGIVAVRLYDGQEMLHRDRYVSDFVELRSLWIQRTMGGGGGGGAFQRVLAADLTLADGECLIIKRYLDLDDYSLTLNGDSQLEILA